MNFHSISSRTAMLFLVVVTLPSLATLTGCGAKDVAGQSGAGSGHVVASGVAPNDESQSCYDPNGEPYPGVVGGGLDLNGDELYYCLAFRADGSQHPGKWVRGDGMCHYSYGGQEIPTNNFNFWLEEAGGNVEWVEDSEYQPVMSSCGLSPFLIGGTGNIPLYGCSGFLSFNNVLTMQPGKVWRGECLVPFGGREVHLNHFYVPFDVPDGDSCITDTYSQYSNIFLNPNNGDRSVLCGKFKYQKGKCQCSDGSVEECAISPPSKDHDVCDTAVKCACQKCWDKKKGPGTAKGCE